jgi:crotonobetainyl-CoA:carnitine CoA-transferase CaiB-like acyl-CoA transferase
LGSIKVVGFPAQFSETPAVIQRAAPELGQHTEEVLHEVLDFSWDQIGQLKEDEVI